MLEEKRVHTDTLSFRRKNRTHFVKTSLQSFFNAINTDFKLYINNLSATVHSKLSQHSKVYNIAQLSKEITWAKMEMTSFAPEEFFVVGQIDVLRKIHYRKTRFSSITRLVMRSVDRSK